MARENWLALRQTTGAQMGAQASGSGDESLGVESDLSDADESYDDAPPVWEGYVLDIYPRGIYSDAPTQIFIRGSSEAS